MESANGVSRAARAVVGIRCRASNVVSNLRDAIARVISKLQPSAIWRRNLADCTFAAASVRAWTTGPIALNVQRISIPVLNEDNRPFGETLDTASRHFMNITLPQISEREREMTACVLADPYSLNKDNYTFLLNALMGEEGIRLNSFIGRHHLGRSLIDEDVKGAR